MLLIASSARFRRWWMPAPDHRARLKLPDLDIAVRTVHFPGEHDDVRLLNDLPVTFASSA